MVLRLMFRIYGHLRGSLANRQSLQISISFDPAKKSFHSKTLIFEYNTAFSMSREHVKELELGYHYAESIIRMVTWLQSLQANQQTTRGGGGGTSGSRGAGGRAEAGAPKPTHPRTSTFISDCPKPKALNPKSYMRDSGYIFQKSVRPITPAILQ